MLKAMLLLTGIAGGVAGATAWLLSEPGAKEAVKGSSGGPLGSRVEELRERLERALEDGRRARAETEELLQKRLQAYRRGGAA